MFRGIIVAQGRVIEAPGTDPRRRPSRLSLDADAPALQALQAGRSIAVNGVCLTVRARPAPGRWQFDVSGETLACTNIGKLHPGSPVNLEPALRLSDGVDGHLVTGHVDAVGRIEQLHDCDTGRRVQISVPSALHRYLAPKGCICVDGVSLTVNALTGTGFVVHIIPHTLEQTLFSGYQPGAEVNIEVDLLARYTARLLEAGSAADPASCN